VKQTYNKWKDDNNKMFYQNEEEVEQTMWKNYIRKTDMNNRQNTHWAVYNDEIVHFECIYSEDVLKQKCKMTIMN